MSTQVIPCVVLGKHRYIAEPIAKRLAEFNYSVNAMLDEESFSGASLDVVLRALHPRPKALIIGGGFSDEEIAPGQKVWEQYVKDVGITDAALVRVLPGTIEKVGKGGVAEWIVGEMRKAFK